MHRRQTCWRGDPSQWTIIMTTQDTIAESATVIRTESGLVEGTGGTMRSFKGGQKTLRHLLGPDCNCREDGGSRWPPQQRTEQLYGGRVGPVEIVQYEDQ